MVLNDVILSINSFLWGWPLVIFILGLAVYSTVMLNFIQFRCFAKAWQLILKPSKDSSKGEISTFEAFINALSTGIGNGGLAGIATAIYAGGPGAAFWIFVLGIMTMAIRFAEVFLSNYFPAIQNKGYIVGGPMVYLQKVPGGKYLSFIFAFALFFFGLLCGNGLQANSIRLGFVRILPVTPLMVAALLFVFIVYVMVGGARRIIEVSDRIVPVKVGLFFITAIMVLVYHYASIWPALVLIFNGAFNPKALGGAAVGMMIQHAIRYGSVRLITATEVGLGTAGVLFGGTGSKEPYKNGLISMVSAFISSNLVCFIIALMIVASGVWDNGQTSLNLTMSAYETVFGTFGSWIVTFLSVSFGIGVLVAYAYITRACWLYLTGGKYESVYTAIFCLVTFFAAMADVEVVWNATDIVNGLLLIANLLGIMWLLPTIRRALQNRKDGKEVTA